MIRRLRIRNFKSLSDIDVSFDPLTIIIGRSGSGKTNLVKAIRFIRDTAGGKSDLVNEEGGWEHIVPTNCQGKTDVAFSVQFTLPDAQDEYCYSASHTIAAAPEAGRRGYSLKSERLEYGGKSIFVQVDGKWEVAPAIVTPPKPNGPMLGKIVGMPEIHNASRALAHGIGCYDFPGTVLQSKLCPDRGLGLSDDGSNHHSVLKSLVSDLSPSSAICEVLGGLRQLNPAIQDIQPAPDGNDDIYVSHRLGSAPSIALTLDQESEGLRRYFAHLLAIYQVPPKQTLVFEEPEKGIYPGALASLAEFLESTAASGRSQVVLTTHNPIFLDHFAPESVRVVEMQDSRTRIGTVSPEQFIAIKDSMMTTGELLTVDPARISTVGAGG